PSGGRRIPAGPVSGSHGVRTTPGRATASMPYDRRPASLRRVGSMGSSSAWNRAAPRPPPEERAPGSARRRRGGGRRRPGPRRRQTGGGLRRSPLMGALRGEAERPRVEAPRPRRLVLGRRHMPQAEQRLDRLAPQPQLLRAPQALFEQGRDGGAVPV